MVAPRTDAETLQDADSALQASSDDAALKPLIVLVGPTGSGKTALSLALAEEFAGEIVSCDSVAVYRHLEIGSAKPTREERARAPHHLIDVAWPDEAFTAGDYARLAREALAGIAERSRLPIIVGGTGLYLRALLDGLFPSPPTDPALRERLRSMAERRGPEYLHRLLGKLDEAAAERIHPNDVPKAVRAVEVWLATRAPMTEQWSKGRDGLTGYRILRLGLAPERARLYERIDRRCALMFAEGLVEETAAIAAEFGENCRALTSLGYVQALAVLRGEMSREEALAATQQGHRNYAKRQGTWFRKERDIEWLPGTGHEVEAEALRRVRAFLAAV